MITGIIDPSARIEAGAKIGKDVSIGPYCTVGAHVSIGDNCRLVAHVNVTGHTTIGPRTVISSLRFAWVATAVAQLSWRTYTTGGWGRLRYTRERDDEYRHRGPPRCY